MPSINIKGERPRYNRESENSDKTIYYNLRDTREMTKEEEAGFLADTKGYSERYVRMFSDEKGRVRYPEKNASV